MSSVLVASCEGVLPSMDRGCQMSISEPGFSLLNSTFMSYYCYGGNISMGQDSGMGFPGDPYRYSVINQTILGSGGGWHVTKHVTSLSTATTSFWAPTFPCARWSVLVTSNWKRRRLVGQAEFPTCWTRGAVFTFPSARNRHIAQDELRQEGRGCRYRPREGRSYSGLPGR